MKTKIYSSLDNPENQISFKLPEWASSHLSNQSRSYELDLEVIAKIRLLDALSISHGQQSTQGGFFLRAIR